MKRYFALLAAAALLLTGCQSDKVSSPAEESSGAASAVEQETSHADTSSENPPTAEELALWHGRSGLPLRRFFNTSGMKYRELNVKAQLDEGMSDEDAYRLLASDGMLVKRPLLVGDGFVLCGFKEAAWEETLL